MLRKSDAAKLRVTAAFLAEEHPLGIAVQAERPVVALPGADRTACPVREVVTQGLFPAYREKVRTHALRYGPGSLMPVENDLDLGGVRVFVTEILVLARGHGGQECRHGYGME